MPTERGAALKQQVEAIKHQGARPGEDDRDAGKRSTQTVGDRNGMNYKQQDTVDYMAKQNAELTIHGRHDPCIVPRAAVVQDTLTALGILDLWTVRYGTAAQKHGLPQSGR